MGHTLAQKMLAAKCGRKEVQPGEIVWAQPDLIAQYMHSAGIPDIRIHPDRVAITIDHTFVPKGEAEARSHANMRETARKYKISNFGEVGRTGVQFQWLAERGLVRPGMLIVHLDPHVSTYGAFGTYSCGIGSDYLQAYQTGEVWLRVPQTVKIDVTGRFADGVTSRDLFGQIINEMGPLGALGQVVQFDGPTVSAMSIESRMVLCNMAMFLSAETAIIESDRKIVDYVKSRTARPFEVFQSDADADYARMLNFDVSDMAPQIVMPDAVYHVESVKAVAGVAIDQGFIGSCASGRMEDLRLAARVLKGRKVHPNVRLVIAPITPEIQKEAAREGLTEIFWEAGALVGPPSCGMCMQLGYGFLLPGETLISTATMNVPGRLGSPEAESYLANPATVAASAVAGKISDPREFL